MRKSILFAVLFCVVSLAGCDAQKAAPHMGFGTLDIKAEFSRDDLVVLDRVEGSSTTVNILLGVIQIVDDDKLRLFWILPFFREQYAAGFYMTSTEDRAYYKALEAAPEADSVFTKSMDSERSGVPLIFWVETATYRGKAIRLKADQERSAPAAATSEAGRKILGYRGDRGKKDADGNPVLVPVYEDEQKK
jgi:hypothetical protein